MRAIALEAKRVCAIILGLVMMLLLTSTGMPMAAEGSQMKASEISAQVKQKISRQMASALSDQVVVFDQQGNKLQRSAKLTPDDLKNYESLENFVRSDRSPVDDCKKPTPVPPPPCVLCDNGEIVCSKALGAKKKAKQM